MGTSEGHTGTIQTGALGESQTGTSGIQQQGRMSGK